MHARLLALALLGLVATSAGLHAQATPLERERAAHLDFLRRSPQSPFAAVAQQPLGDRLTLGPDDADIPIAGVTLTRVERTGTAAMVLGADGYRRPLGRTMPVTVGRVRLLLRGLRERPVLTVFDVPAPPATTRWFPLQPSAVEIVTLRAPTQPKRTPALGPDGAETMAGDAGSVTLAGGETLLVRRYETGDDEAELEIFFRDATNGRETYPAGRFVALEPLGDGRYRLDFNRARNPFCAYSTVFPCPPPWAGNALARPIRAGERYDAKP